MRSTAYIFGMKQCLVVPHINPANQAPGVQTGPALGPRVSIDLQLEKHFKKSCNSEIRIIIWIQCVTNLISGFFGLSEFKL